MAELDQITEGKENTVENDVASTSTTMEWPRMIAPPLKRSGHVILEVCSASGKKTFLLPFHLSREADNHVCLFS